MAKNTLRVEKVALRAVPAFDMRTRFLLGDGVSGFARLLDEIQIEDIRVAQDKLAALPLAQELAGSADMQVLFGDREAVVAPSNRLQALSSRLREIAKQENARAVAIAASNPAPQLMQLREAEPLCALDHHQRGVRHVDADFD